MSELNDRYMEAYKHLDKLCREMYQQGNGVTSYIEAMEIVHDGSRKVALWDYTLRKLKDYRHIRNSYSHEVGTSYIDICTKEDVRWLEEFYDSIIAGTDPLTIYRRQTSRKKIATSNTYQKKLDNSVGQQVEDVGEATNMQNVDYEFVTSKKIDAFYEREEKIKRNFVKIDDEPSNNQMIMATLGMAAIIGAIALMIIQLFL